MQRESAGVASPRGAGNNLRSYGIQNGKLATCHGFRIAQNSSKMHTVVADGREKMPC